MALNRRKTILKYVVPSMLTNVSYFLFTIVDGIFVGNGVGEAALGGVNVAIPFLMIVMALGMLTSIGGAVMSAIRFGQGRPEDANRYFLHSVALTTGIAVLVMLAGVGLTRPVAVLMGADEAHMAYVTDYLFWCSLFAIPSLLSVNLQGFCRNDGAPALVAAATVISSALNIFLDWLFVFPLGMGVKGAAIATGISQSANLLIVLSHFLRKKGQLRFRTFRFSPGAAWEIVFCGFPEMMAQFATPVMTICMNQMLGRYLPEYGIDVFAVISYVSSFAMAVMFGTSEGLQPLFGRCYGAGARDDLHWFLRSGLVICGVGSVLCVLASVLLAEPISVLFGAEGATVGHVRRCMPQYAWAFVLAGINTLISGYLYSTEKTKAAILLNVLRSFVFCILAIVGLTVLCGAGILWYTFGIAEAAVTAVAVGMLLRGDREIHLADV